LTLLHDSVLIPSQDVVRAVTHFRLADILPLYVPSRRFRFDIKTLSETRISPSFSVDNRASMFPATLTAKDRRVGIQREYTHLTWKG
jgi:hypothetical protein